MEEQKNNQQIGPTIQDTIKIFMNYWGQEFIYNGSVGTKRKITGLSHGWNIIEEIDQMATYRIDRCRILLKPIGNISTEEVFELSELLNISKNSVLNAIDRIINNSISRETLYIDIAMKMMDYLREKGYALPYKHWSVEQLVEFGIYKLIE